MTETEPAPSDFARLREDRVAIALLLFGALVRLLFFLETPGVDVRSWLLNDANMHHEQARQVASGDLLLTSRFDYHDGRPIPRFTDCCVDFFGLERYTAAIGPNTYSVYPGYCYIVGAVYRVFGPETRAIFFLQEALDLLACAFTYLLGLRLYDRTVARVGLLLAVATGPLVFYAGFLLRETLLASLIVMLLYAVVRAADRGRGLGAWVVAGLVCGVTWIVKGSFLPLAPFLAPSFFVRDESERRRVGPRIAAFALGAATVIAPFVARNVYVGVPPFLMASNEVAALIIFNSPGAAERGVGIDLPRAQHAANRCPTLTLPNAVVAVIEEHGSLASLLREQGTRVANLWIADDPWDDVRFSYVAPCLHSLALAPVRWKLIAPYAILGMILVLVQDPKRRYIVLGPVFLTLFTAALTSCLTRYRILGDHMHALLAASAFVWLFREARHKHIRAILAAVGALLLVQVLHDSVPPPTHTQIARHVLGFGPETSERLLRNLGKTPVSPAGGR